MGEMVYTYDLTRNEWESLRLLWNHFHTQNDMPEDEVLRVWRALEEYGFGCLKKGSVGGVRRTEDGNPTQDEKNLWHDFIIDLMGSPFRKVMQIKSASALIREFRKYRLRILSPCCKEVYDVPSEALNQLVNRGVLCRTGKSQKISDETRFWRSGGTASCGEAGFDMCEQHCLNLEDLGLRKDQRGFSTLHRRMITPKCASEFVMQVFEKLGDEYSVRMEVLKQCIFLKTRNMFSPQTVEYKDEISSSESHTDGHAESKTDADKQLRWEATRFARINTADEGIGEQYSEGEENDSAERVGKRSLPNQQQEKLAKAVASRIWNRIGDMGESSLKILVGYIFPKMEGKKVSMRKFGKITTVDYRIEKIFGAIRSELKAAMPQEVDCSYVEDPVVQLTVATLRDFCSENHEDVCLDGFDEKKEEHSNDSKC